MKLHIGGKQVKPGWKILNAQKFDGVDFVGDITDLSQFQDESCEEIYASHVLEHVNQAQALPTLKGIYRTLKAGGKFYVSVPDLDILCHTFLAPLAPMEVKFHVMRMMFGGQVDPYDFHYFGWNQEFLSKYLHDAGFDKMQRVGEFGLFNDTSSYKPYGAPISLNMIAIK